jgi:hypothetical protein
VGCPAYKEVYCASNLTFQSPRPDASLTLCHQTALAQHPVHPILVCGGSECEILLWVLSSPTVGTPAPIFPTSPITIRSHRHHFPCIARRARVVSTSTANAPSCDALPGGRLKHLSSDIAPARPPARLRVKRPHDPLLGALSPRRCSPSLSLPSAVLCLPLWAQTASQRARAIHLLCPAPLRHGSGHARWVVELGQHSGWRARRSRFRGGRRYRARIRWRQQ